MKITPNKLKWFVELQSKIEDVAVEIGKIQETYPKFNVADISSIDVDLGKKQIHVCGSVYFGQGGDEFFSIIIPFEYFEDPVAWEDKYQEEQHQKLLKKIEDHRVKQKEDAEAVERGERKLLAELKEKYDE